MRDINQYTRVTEALAYFSGLKFIDPEVLRRAAERGTKVHEICAAIMENIGVSEIESNLQGYVDSFSQWNENKTFLPTPDRFFCDKYMITGEVDGLYIEDGKIVLFDLKTSASENITWVLQGSAYAYLCRLHGIDIFRVEFIKLSKDGKKAKVYVYEEKFDMYLKCLELHNHFYKKMSKEDLLENI